MKVYRDTNTSVTFEHPFPGPLVARVYRGGVLILESASLTPVAGRYTLPLSYKETQYDGPLTVQWEGMDGTEIFMRTTTVEVVTPLISLSKLRTVFPDSNWPDEELRELEHTVRVFIESYTNQTFGYRLATETVVGTGDARIALPSRLIRATIVSMGHIANFSVSSDGWHLYIRNNNYLTTKEMPPEEFESEYVYATRGVIYVPDTYWRKFRKGQRYEITGEWGYYNVPDEVQEAALLLANDFGCGDNLYRDRYLKSIKAGDWNMVYTEGAYRGTGNARADQLLSGYRREGMIVI